ncbi:MAG: methyltransferase domain-containing protein [Sphingomonadaceae bacterium]
MKLVLDRMGINQSTSILHLAPERGLYSYIKSISDNYVVGDIDLERYSHIPDIKFIDLCDPGTLSDFGSYDLIIHSHVIEHVPCNWTVVMTRLHRMLNAGGHHVFCIPIYGTCYDEYLGDISDGDAERRFGQFDHVRRFSAADLQKTLGALFNLPESYSLLEHFSDSQLRQANIPEVAWFGYTGHSIFCLKRDDILI